MSIDDAMVARFRESLWSTWGAGRLTTDWPSRYQLRVALEAALGPLEAVEEERDEWKLRAGRAEAEAAQFSEQIAHHNREERQAKAKLTEFLGVEEG